MRLWIKIVLLLIGVASSQAWAADETGQAESTAPAPLAVVDPAAPAPEPQGIEYELNTWIEILGLHLLPLSPEGVLGAQDATNWMVRLIDPTESLDNMILPDTATTASYRGVLDSPERIVAVLFDVPIDLSGGDAESTPVDVLIPVELDSNEVTELDAKVSLSQTDNEEWVVDLDYQVIRGGQARRQRCRLYWASQTLVYDEDGDGIYETEASEPDPDRNCLGGEQRWRRQGPRDGHGQGQGQGSGSGNGPRDGHGRRQGGNGNGSGGRHAGK